MNWPLVLAALGSAAGLAGCYALMALVKGSPQKLLGEAFKMPDVHLRYTPDALYQTFDTAGTAGRPLMRRYWLLDFGLIIFLTAVMIAAAGNLVPKDSWVYPLMNALALARSAADIAEDLLLLALLKRYPEHRNGMARLASAATGVKHALLAAWLAPLFIQLFFTAFHISL